MTSLLTAKSMLRQQMERTRAATIQLVSMASANDFTLLVHPFYSPIGWHLGHVGMVEEYWILERAFGEKPHNPELSFIFANIPENPKSNRINLPALPETLAWLSEIRARTLARLENYRETAEPLLRDAYCFKFALQHEHQHQETIVELLQLLNQKDGSRQAVPELPDNGTGTDSRIVQIKGGKFIMGTGNLHAYDNEKQPHERSVSDFGLCSHLVTAGEWLEFMADGGYAKQELWTSDGWRWRESENANAPEYWVMLDGHWHYYSPLGPRKLFSSEPVSSISWFEADAFARWRGLRLPTEAEWEYAASCTNGEKRAYPWGESEPSEKLSNCALHNWGTVRSGAYPAGATPEGIYDMAGQVWEWTSSSFAPYPDFEPWPYDGYSKEHMDGSHKVLRGGSWASQPEVLRCTFRNWYVPTYRQGLLGMRLAADA